VLVGLHDQHPGDSAAGAVLPLEVPECIKPGDLDQQNTHSCHSIAANEQPEPHTFGSG
jgi:hypothetical protein